MEGGEPEGGGARGGRGSIEGMKIVRIYKGDREREKGNCFLFYNVWWFL